MWSHCSLKVRTSIQVVRGRFSRSLYVGRITENFFLAGEVPVCDCIRTAVDVEEA